MALTQKSLEVTRYSADKFIRPVGAAQSFYYGSLLVQEGGYMKKVSGANQGQFKCVGVARGLIPAGQNITSNDDVDNSAGAAGAVNVLCEAGVLSFKNSANAAAGLLTQADAGLPCYAADDEVVSLDPAEGNRPVAGTFLGIDPKTSRCMVFVGIDQEQAPRIHTIKANADLRLLQYTCIKFVNDAAKAEAASCAAGTDINIWGILLNTPNIDEWARVVTFGVCPGKAVAGGYTAGDVLMAGAGGCLIVVAAARYSIAIALESAGVSATEMVFVQRGTVLA